MRQIAFIFSVTAIVASRQTPAQGAGKIPITTRSEEARALFVRGRTLNEGLQPHDAYAVFQQAVAIDPTFAMGEYSLASTAPTAKDIADHLRKALALASNASPGERMLIRSLEARTNADPNRARQIAESLAIQYPRDERAHWTLANAYGAAQLYDKAIVEYQKAIDINPLYSLAYNQLGYAYRSAGNMTAAEGAFRKYIALVPNDPNPYDSYAELLMKTGRFDESITQYKKALSIDPHFSGSPVGIAADEMLAGRHAAAAATAQAYYDKARDDGERRTAQFNLAMIHVDAGATDKALQALERRYAISSAIGDTANMAADGIAIADVLLEAHRIAPARDRYRQAHDLVARSSLPADAKQDDALAQRYDLARVALASHDVATARTEAAAYMSGANGRNNPARVRQAHELNALIAIDAKEFDKSLTELALADQQNPAVWYAMARANAGKGDREKARQLTAQAVGMNILPTLPYVFTRASAAAATGSATSDNAHGKPR